MKAKLNRSINNSWECVEETVGKVISNLCLRPRQYIFQRWNWKAALLSAIVRASIFFFANLTAGQSAAVAAMIREFLFRSIASGFYGGMTESFRNAKPRWAATLVVLVTMPFLNHSAEFLLHWLLGTPNLKTSMIASVGFTILSTGFNLYAMRREVLTTRQNCRGLGEDLKMIPGLLISFSVAIIKGALAVPANLCRLCMHENRRLKQPEEGIAYSSEFVQSKKEQKVPA
jgi:hypothetical protein